MAIGTWIDMPMVQHQVVRMEVGGTPLFRVWLACGHQFDMNRNSFTEAGVKVPELGDFLVCGDCTRLYGEAKRTGGRLPYPPNGNVYRPSDLRNAERAYDAAMGAGELRFRTNDHPAAKGNEALIDRRGWTFNFPLEDGRTLYLELGAKGRAILESLILGEMLESARGAHDNQEDG